MPLTGTDPALMVARLGTMRLGASRLGYYEPIVTITINGILLTGETKALAVEGLTITDLEGGTPNTATLTLKGVTPIEGQEIRIGLGGLGRGQIIFAGHILHATQVYVGGASNIAYQVSCISYEWLLNDRPLSGKFLSTSATDIVLWIMSGVTGFSTAGVAAGLPSLDQMTFTNVDRTDALDRVTKRIGGAWVVDYASPPVLHFGLSITPGASAIHPITTANTHGMTALKKTVDLSQARTREEVEGGGANATAQVPAGSSTLPIGDPSWYAALGGQVRSGPQPPITYGGVVVGGAGALVGTTVVPTNGPTVTPRAATGLNAGDYLWGVVFGTAAGRTTLSPLTGLTLGGALAPPPAPATPLKQFGGGKTAGVHKWKFAYLTAAGQTLASAESAAVTLDDITAPTSIGTASAGAPGSLDTSFKYTFFGGGSSVETTPSPASNTVASFASPTTPRMARAGCQNAPPGFERQFYRTEDGGATYKKMTGASDGFLADDATYFKGSVTDANLGANAPSTSTAVYRSATLVVPVSANPLVTHVRILCTEAGGSVFKTVADVVNGTTPYLDTTADGALGATELSTATALNLAADLSNIPIGPTGTTYRDLFRTVVNGAALLFMGTIANNTSTGPFTDTVADGSLGAAAPTTDTSGLVVQTGEVPAGSTSLLVTATAPFQAAGGWASLGALSIRYTGVSGTALTGIPATGIGALTTTVRYGSEVIAASMLTGIPASGPGAILYDIPAGEPVNLFVTRNNLPAQAALAALLTTPTRTHDGIVVESIQNHSLGQTECENRGDARLAEVKDPLVGLTYQTPDLTHRSGREVTFALDAPTSIAGTFKVQRVTLSQFAGGRSRPIRTVDASSRRLSFEAILRLVKAA